MRAWLVVCAALALAPCRATAAHSPADPARLERIKSHILAKPLTHSLGPTGRPCAPGSSCVRRSRSRRAERPPRTRPRTY
ncbi:hypothetical protein ABMA27_010801 [Loxostege sticticalis]|uniref:Uncharacterized protein n=1 Tax=Loxostege sticticalis TaxID=481309 RepID=A0ABR3H4G1_LOXSC